MGFLVRINFDITNRSLGAKVFSANQLFLFTSCIHLFNASQNLFGLLAIDGFEPCDSFTTQVEIRVEENVVCMIRRQWRRLLRFDELLFKHRSSVGDRSNALNVNDGRLGVACSSSYFAEIV